MDEGHCGIKLTSKALKGRVSCEDLVLHISSGCCLDGSNSPSEFRRPMDSSVFLCLRRKRKKPKSKRVMRKEKMRERF